MARLRGTGVGMGVALGTAAVVRVHRGVALAPEPTEAVARQIALGRQAEKPDVIVVAADYMKALAVADALEWGNVVGVATESILADAPMPEFPAVMGVVGLMEAVKDNGLMLVDAERGIVIAGPDGLDIASYQAERTNLSPRKTLYLDEAHQSVRTLDGRPIQVVAIVENTAEVDRALEEGADALYIPCDTLLPTSANGEELRRRLFKLIERAPGKPLLLADYLYLPHWPIVEAATRADLTISNPSGVEDGIDHIASLKEQLEDVLEECLDVDVSCALPRFALTIADLGDAYYAAQVIDLGATRYIVDMERGKPFMKSDRAFAEDVLPKLETMFMLANENMIAVYFRLLDYNAEDFTQEVGLQMLVAAGVTGILTPNAGQVKTTIRGLSFAECQEMYLQTMRAAGVEV